MLKTRGFTLVEVMVAVTIGMIISSALALIFVRTTNANQEVKRFGEQIENGRIAMDMLGQDLRTAGFWGSLDMTKMDVPLTMPDPCEVAVADISAAIPVHIQGYDNNDGGLDCLSDVKANTDVLVIRRAATVVTPTPSVTGTYFQTTQCSPPNSATELADPAVSNHFIVGDSTANFANLHKRDCATQADIRRYMVHIYYIANNTETGDGIPALKMVELGAGDFNKTTPSVIAPGIEQLQLEYGSDTETVTTPGTPDTYSATPPALPADVAKVVTVKLHILSRNTSASPGYVDNKSYVLGLKADGSANTYAATHDAYRRHVYLSSILMSAPSGLRGGG